MGHSFTEVEEGGENGIVNNSNKNSSNSHETKSSATATATIENDDKKSYPNQTKSGQEQKRSLLNRLFFFWFDKFVLLGQNRNLNPTQFWDLEPDFR